MILSTSWSLKLFKSSLQGTKGFQICTHDKWFRGLNSKSDMADHDGDNTWT